MLDQKKLLKDTGYRSHRALEFLFGGSIKRTHTIN